MRKLLAEDFKNYRFLSDIKFSSNGKNSVFSVAKASSKNSYDSNLYICRDSGGISQLTSSGSESKFLWDDDKTVLFASSRAVEKNSGTSFYRININGGEAVSAFNLPMGISSISKIAEEAYLICASVDINKQDFSVKEQEKKPEGFTILDELPFWSNGAGLVNGLRHRLFIYSENTDELTPFTPCTTDVSEIKVINENQVIYSACDYVSLKPFKEHIYLYNIAKNSTTQLTNEDYEVFGLEYHNGRVIFAGTNRKAFGMSENPKFYSIDIATKTTTLLADYDNSVASTVSTDCRLGGGTRFKISGDYLYFTSTVGFSTNIYRLSLDSGEIEAVTAASGCIDCFDICEDKILAVALTDLNLQELYAVENSNLQILSAFNVDALSDITLSLPIHHSLKTNDGFQLDGWVMLPTDFTQNKTYPAILHIHGGPKNAFGELFFHEMQLWANNGYFVVYCNPRGGDGKGNVFADIRGKYGTCDYNGIMAFLDEALNIYPQIDESRLGIVGGSYGGFMTNWAIGRTQRFKAAVSQRSISNWTSFAFTSDIGHLFADDQIAANAWDNPEKMWDTSPLKYAANVTTPTLFIHSDNDYRCWIGEGYQMFNALKMRGVESRMCVFHGENHDLSRTGKPDNREKRLNEIFDWLNTHLRP